MKYYEVFTKDKEKQKVKLGDVSLYLVRGFTKNGDIYHRVDAVDNKNIRVLSQFIQLDQLGYYIHLVEVAKNEKNEAVEKLGSILELLQQGNITSASLLLDDFIQSIL